MEDPKVINGEQVAEQEAPKTESPEQKRTYGAVYTPSGAPDGEYDFRSYTRAEGSEEARTQQNYAAMGLTYAEPKKEKKKSSAGKIIGITVAVILCIAVLAGAVIGVMYAGKAIFSALPNSAAPEDSGQKQEKSNTSEGLIPFDDYSGTYVQRASTSSGVGSGSLVHEVPRGTKMDLEDAVAAVRDSVVEIRTESVQRDSFFGGSYVTQGAGSGVIIASNGIIITNHHVIEGAKSITVRLTDGTEFKDVKMVASDEEADIAVLSLDPGDKHLCVAVLGHSAALRAAQSVFVIGNPLGELGGSVSAGIISATNREISVGEVGSMRLIQTDAAVNPGNSGGGLFNLYGELVGIINSKYSESGIEGLGFAIPIDDAWAVAEDLLQVGYVQGRVLHGLKGLTLSEEQVQYAFSYTNCVVVSAVEGKSSFKVGDIIEKVNGVSVSSISDVKRVLRSIDAGTKVQVYVTRQVKNGGFFSTTQSGVLEAEVCEVEQTGLDDSIH